MGFDAVPSKQLVWHAREGSPTPYYGWYLTWSGGSRSVHPFESRPAKQAFIEAVRQVGGLEDRWIASIVAATVALATWGSTESDREAGRLNLQLKVGAYGTVRARMDDLLNLAEEWDTSRGRRPARENEDLLKETLAGLDRPGMAALGATTAPPLQER